MLSASSISCGVRQLHGINRTPAKVLKTNFKPNPNGWPDPNPDYFCMVLFSDIVRDTPSKIGGEALAKYLKNNKLGLVQQSGAFINPNSGNKIRVWTWHVNKQNLKKWLGKNASAR